MNRKKMKTRSLFVFLLAVILLVAAIGCGKLSGSKGGSDASGPAQTTRKEDNKSPSPSFTFTDDKKGLAWPRDRMGGLAPVDATIVAAVDGGDGYMVTFTDFKYKAAQKYVADLRKMGFTPTLDSDTPETILFYGYTEDERAVMFVYDVKEESGSLTYIEES